MSAREVQVRGSRMPVCLSRTHTNSIRLHLTRTFPSPPLLQGVWRWDVEASLRQGLIYVSWHSLECDCLAVHDGQVTTNAEFQPYLRDNYMGFTSLSISAALRSPSHQTAARVELVRHMTSHMTSHLRSVIVMTD